MPMPPTINPYDPRKKRLEQPTQQPQQKPVEAQPAAPVQSALAPMPQGQPATQAGQQPVAQAGQPQQAQQTEKKRAAMPVTYQQQAGAVADPRFSQALAQKLQQDVAAKQATLQQQQAQFQEKLNQAGGSGASTQQRVGDLLNKISSGTASKQDIDEYQNLQRLEYSGPMGLDGTANIAALSRLAGSPELLAQQYAGFAPGGVRASDFAKSLAGLQKTPELQAAQEAAAGLAGRAVSAEETAAQQAALLKGQTEATKQAAISGAKAKETELTGQLTGQKQSEIGAKQAALDKLKEGLFLTGNINKKDLEKLGLKTEDISGLAAFDISKVGGLQGVKTTADLNKKLEDLENKKLKGESLSPEQEKALTLFKQVNQLSRGTDEASILSYAKKEDLARINALRQLKGESPLTEESLKQAQESGKLSRQDISGLIGSQREQLKYGPEKEKTQADLKADKNILRGDQAVKGGLTSFQEELKNPDPSYESIYRKAVQFYDNVKSGKSGIYRGSGVADALDKMKQAASYVNNQSGPKGNPRKLEEAKKLADKARRDLRNIMEEMISKYEGRVSKSEQSLAGMDEFSKKLSIK